jgi:hypothetical protein
VWRDSEHIDIQILLLGITCWLARGLILLSAWRLIAFCFSESTHYGEIVWSVAWIGWFCLPVKIASESEWSVIMREPLTICEWQWELREWMMRTIELLLHFNGFRSLTWSQGIDDCPNGELNEIESNARETDQVWWTTVINWQARVHFTITDLLCHT